jgi:hypothetical protein
MTTLSDTGVPAPFLGDGQADRRGSWIPTWSMVTTRFMELRRRKGLIIALVAVNVGIPVIFLAVRLISHAVAPKSYGPAGGYTTFTTLVVGVMYIFGFIVAAVVGCTAGSVDLNEGMFRHLVITGRSRLALYLARIPAGLAIVISIVAIGYMIVCAVCVFAAPTQLNYDGVNVPQGLSRPALDTWAAAHADEVICNFNYNGQSIPPNVPCGGNGQNSGPPPGATVQTPKGTVTVPTYTHAQVRAFHVAVRCLQSCRHGLTLASIALAGHHPGPRLGCLLRRVVSGSVVEHQNFVHQTVAARGGQEGLDHGSDDGADCRAFIPRGNAHRDRALPFGLTHGGQGKVGVVIGAGA